MSKILKKQVNRTFLYDPLRGFIYYLDLFEKDLYKQGLNEKNKEETIKIFQCPKFSGDTSHRY